MFGKSRMEYVIKTCSAQNAQELQNLLNEMSMKGWELYILLQFSLFVSIFVTEVHYHK